MTTDDGLDEFRDDESSPDDTEATPTLFYGSVDEFVRERLIHMYARKVGGHNAANHWAADWWHYPEAISRLESLWRAWEHLRQDPATGMSTWWRDHADHHMRVLFSSDGPFAKATDVNGDGGRLPYTPPPEGLFPDMR